MTNVMAATYVTLTFILGLHHEAIIHPQRLGPNPRQRRSWR
jgi:tetrahydromethanopterin S-methyltransferase subunit C